MKGRTAPLHCGVFGRERTLLSWRMRNGAVVQRYTFYTLQLKQLGPSCKNTTRTEESPPRTPLPDLILRLPLDEASLHAEDARVSLTLHFNPLDHLRLYYLHHPVAQGVSVSK